MKQYVYVLGSEAQEYYLVIRDKVVINIPVTVKTFETHLAQTI